MSHFTTKIDIGEILDYLESEGFCVIPPKAPFESVCGFIEQLLQDNPQLPYVKIEPFKEIQPQYKEEVIEKIEHLASKIGWMAILDKLNN